MSKMKCFIKNLAMYEISNYSNNIRKVETNSIFTQNQTNLEYQEFLIWLKKNNSPIFVDYFNEEIAEANKPKVPIQVKNMKFRLALIKSGIMPSSIDTAINQMPEGAMKENIFTLWNFADYLERNDVSLNYMAGQFNISQEQLDNLFILSDTI